jgi:hypothetical protein
MTNLLILALCYEGRQNTTNWSEDLTQSPFKLDGTYKHLRDPLEANVHDLLDLNNRFLPDDDPSVLVHASEIIREACPSHLISPIPPKYDAL